MARRMERTGRIPIMVEGQCLCGAHRFVLDDPPPLTPQEHIWTAEIPGWSGVYDGLPQHEGACRSHRFAAPVSMPRGLALADYAADPHYTLSLSPGFAVARRSP